MAHFFVCFFRPLHPRCFCLYLYIYECMLPKYFPIFFSLEMFSFFTLYTVSIFPHSYLFRYHLFYPSLLVSCILLKCLRNYQLPNLQIQWPLHMLPAFLSLHKKLHDFLFFLFRLFNRWPIQYVSFLFHFLPLALFFLSSLIDFHPPNC